MERAGAAAMSTLSHLWPDARSIAVVAGPGNNGGDGLVLARLARQQGMTVVTLLVGEAGDLHGEALQAFQDLRRAGQDVRPFDAALLDAQDLIVDALLGIGVRAPLRPEWHAAILAMNACGCQILSLDLPSGLDPDTGHALPAVRATATLSFLALKQGLFLAEGRDDAGLVLFDDLGVQAPEEVTPSLRRMNDQCLAAALAPRPRDSHKGLFGRVLVIGGGNGMPGAVRLAAESALRVGAGLVTVASRPEHLAAVVGARPELMFHAVAEASDIDLPLSQADVVAIGPGLGRSEWARALLERVFALRVSGQRLVVDADALNLIAAGAGPQHCDDWVLTPHPGEAARLLGCDTQEVQQDRLAALAALCQRRGGSIVLKGAGTLVGSRGHVPLLCQQGNPGMAAPGMGDVLTGAVAGILAQGAEPFAAAAAAVHAHAMAGDHCMRGGLRGMLALEVAQELRAVLAPLA
jgi:NAD(P)H-hydrate epimerase